MDIKIAFFFFFFYGDFDETIYMVQLYKTSRLVPKVNLVDDCIYHTFYGTKRLLAKNFEMKVFGYASLIWGIQIDQDRSRRILRFSQETS
ncbi:hypothetical protein MTR_7g077610 [Medicago truncatula]|uniref:Uncharacterized protein n=1 Tax=Medicago truncatula TaxID=3880 RepID=G7L4M5_MEDTR|nr:hypothetical protein MTR_7g077610 [Medicago truncatula]